MHKNSLSRFARKTIAALTMFTLSASGIAGAQNLSSDRPSNTGNKTSPLRSRFSFESPLACMHSYTQWGGTPVHFNQDKNFGLFANYNVKQGEKHDLAIGTGYYTNSVHRISKVAKGEYTRYFGTTNRYDLSFEAGIATYPQNIRKEFVTAGNGAQYINPHGWGPEKIVPYYRVKAGVNIINNDHLRAGVVAGYTYDPIQNMSIASVGVNYAFGHRHSSYGGTKHRAEYLANKQDMQTMPKTLMYQSVCNPKYE